MPSLSPDESSPLVGKKSASQWAGRLPPVLCIVIGALAVVRMGIGETSLQDAVQSQTLALAADVEARMAEDVGAAVNRAYIAAQGRLAPSRATLQDVTVPNIVHFVWGSRPNKEDFPFAFFCNIVSAVVQLAPQKILIHHQYPSSGIWWEALKHIYVIKLQYREMPSQVLGNPIENYSHKTDVLRLELLREFGGIYMDTDVLSLRPFDDLRAHGTQFMMGLEEAATDNPTPHGLGSAVILGAPNSNFGNLWYAQYKDYSPEKAGWATYAVKMPLTLSNQHPEAITILPKSKTFFKPLWDEEGIYELFVKNTYDFSNNYAVHFWNLISWDFLRVINPGHLMEGDPLPENTCLRMYRHALPQDLRKAIFDATAPMRPYPPPPKIKGPVQVGINFEDAPLFCNWEKFKSLPQPPMGVTCEKYATAVLGEMRKIVNGMVGTKGEASGTMRNPYNFTS